MRPRPGPGQTCPTIGPDAASDRDGPADPGSSLEQGLYQIGRDHRAGAVVDADEFGRLADGLQAGQFGGSPARAPCDQVGANARSVRTGIWSVGRRGCSDPRGRSRRPRCGPPRDLPATISSILSSPNLTLLPAATTTITRSIMARGYFSPVIDLQTMRRLAAAQPVVVVDHNGLAPGSSRSSRTSFPCQVCWLSTVNEAVKQVDGGKAHRRSRP